ALGVGLTDVLDELRDRNQDISGGRIFGENSEPLIRTLGRFQNAEELENLSFEVSSTDNTSPTRRVYLRDFAQVIDGSEEQRVFVLLNGEEAVKLSVQKQPDANTVNVVDDVKKRLEQLKQSGIVPEGTVITTTSDESQFIRNSISNVTTSGLIGTLLAGVAVLLFLGSIRQTIIIVLAIPLATLAAIILMGISGLSLNVFSLGGLALGVGIVVDNSIVMLENIAEGAGMTPGKNTKTRLSPYQLINQAEQSSKEVESALIASTSTNLVAVLPFILIGGFISLLFNELILTISFSIAASILIAVTVVPMMTSRLLSWRWSSQLNEFWLLVQFNNRFEDATRAYSNFLAKVLRLRLLAIGL
ncbi:MAG: efflux RND transporter permease subunit, partial [Cyanobacteria bacterium J06649_11]